MRSIEIERLEIILAALKRGFLADEIDQILAEQDRLRSDQLGYHSEERVRRILLGLPEVSAVHHTTRRSLADLLGKDLIVYLREDGVVAVQVKSSRFGIEAYIRELADKWHSTREGVTARLRLERLIVLNGQDPEKQVARNFRQDLTRILNTE